MNGDVQLLLVSTSEELTGHHDPELERQLAWLRAWYGSCHLYRGARIPDEWLRRREAVR